MASSSSSFKQALSEPGRILSHLYSHIDEQKRLLTALRKALPETLAMHALYCLESDNKLLIYTDSQVWATQLRFRGKPLIEAAQPLCRKRIEVVQVRLVKPWGVSSERYVRTATLPSRQSIAAIRAGATGNSDGVLQLALLKLTATLERLSGEKPDNPE